MLGDLYRYEFEDLSISVRMGRHVSFNNEVRTNFRHYHDCYEIFHVISGQASYMYGGQNLTVKAGDVALAEPDILHEILVNPQQTMELYFLQFAIERSERIPMPSEEARMVDGFVARHAICRPARTNLQPYLDYLEQSTGDDRLLKRMVFSLLLEYLLSLTLEDSENASSIPSVSDARFRQAMQCISESMPEGIAVEDLARSCSMSVRSLQLLFRRHCGATVVATINGRRCREAAARLLMGFQVQQAGEYIGIPDPGQFSRFFKRHFGMNPKRYQMETSPGRSRFVVVFPDKGLRREG